MGNAFLLIPYVKLTTKEDSAQHVIKVIKEIQDNA